MDDFTKPQLKVIGHFERSDASARSMEAALLERFGKQVHQLTDEECAEMIGAVEERTPRCKVCGVRPVGQGLSRHAVYIARLGVCHTCYANRRPECTNRRPAVAARASRPTSVKPPEKRKELPMHERAICVVCEEKPVPKGESATSVSCQKLEICRRCYDNRHAEVDEIRLRKGMRRSGRGDYARKGADHKKRPIAPKRAAKKETARPATPLRMARRELQRQITEYEHALETLRKAADALASLDGHEEI